MIRYSFALPALLLALPLQAADAPASAPAPAAAPIAAAPAPAAAPAVAAEAASVTRAQFTSAMNDREPADSITTLSNDQTRIYFFSELRGLAGKNVIHRWEHNGKVMHDQPFDVGSARWRVFSSKTLDPSWTGEWKVSVMDGDSTLSVSTFSYNAAETKPVATAPAATPAPAAAKPQ
jgi:hypothetical protein